ncbi:MAG: respiratory nitrate reductase subunit gamma [Rhodocyclaceae bacterium]
MADWIYQFAFGFYPYLALSVFLIGSLVRFDREQYTWEADSSQILRKGSLRLGSTLFHLGILVVFFGHLIGFLTPEQLILAIMSPEAHEAMAMVGGGVAGAVALVGLTILCWRRLTDARVRANSRFSDIAVLIILWVQLAMGMFTVLVSASKPEGYSFEVLVQYVQGIVFFRGDNAALLAGTPWLYKLHILLGLTIFAIFPFTRLVHIWSGLASVVYLFRPYQIMRTRQRSLSR